jgi:enterobacterial common antigen flippase
MLAVRVNTNGELIASRCNCAPTILTTGGPAVAVDPQPEAASDERAKRSYSQILKSSALIGGSSTLNIAIGIIRTKAMAVLLGPAGFGLFGVYGSIANLTQSIAGMGINSSGVRQIAEAVGSGDKTRIAQTTAVLRRTSIVLGLLGAAALLVFSRQVSRLTFGSTERATAVSMLSVVVFLSLVSAGQGALIQGMRRIADLAKMSVLGALFGACLGIPLVYFFREKGVVPSLVGVAAMTILTSWWYSRKIDVESTTVTLSQVAQEASALLKLGSAFMASGLMTMGVAYATRIILLRRVGLEATGLYQSAWTLGGLYVGFILQAMAADFYPRLTACVNNHDECNRLVNDQTLIGLLLAGPGVLATITFAPLVVTVLYSAKFAAAVEVLRWICLGAMLQVITWPMGFIIVAKGRPAIFFLAELSWTVVASSLAWTCVRFLGLNGAGMAFFGSYVFHLLLIYPLAGRLTGYRCSAAMKRTFGLFVSFVALVHLAFRVLPFKGALFLDSLFVAAGGIYSIRTIIRLVPLGHVPSSVRKVLNYFNLSRVSSSSFVAR